MIGIAILLAAADSAAQAPPTDYAALLGSVVGIVGLLAAGWQRLRAARLTAMLHAVAVGLKATLDALPADEADAVKAPIGKAAEAAGVKADLKREVAKATNNAIAVPPELGRAHGVTLLGVVALALALASVLCTPGCVAAEVPHAAARLAATARILEAGARAHDVYAAGSASERAAALAGYQDLTAEHRRYAEELVAASGGDMAEVDAIEAAWRARASERARARREAAGAITTTPTAGTR